MRVNPFAFRYQGNGATSLQEDLYKAMSLSHAMTDPRSIVCMCSAQKVMSVTVVLTCKFTMMIA